MQFYLQLTNGMNHTRLNYNTIIHNIEKGKLKLGLKLKLKLTEAKMGFGYFYV